MKILKGILAGPFLTEIVPMEWHRDDCHQTPISVLQYSVEGLSLLISGKVDTLVPIDMPPSYFADIHANYEINLLDKINSCFSLDTSIVAMGCPEKLPLQKIIAMGLRANIGTDNYSITQEHHTIYVYCRNLIPYDPSVIDADSLIRRTEIIYRMASKIVEQVKEKYTAALDTESPVFELYVSGYMSGTAIAQLVAISLEYDKGLGLISRGVSVSSIGFGEYRIFSPDMIDLLRDTIGFDSRKHIVFSSLEHYFSPNFNTNSRFGTVIDLPFESALESKKNCLDNLNLILDSKDDLKFYTSGVTFLVNRALGVGFIEREAIKAFEKYQNTEIPVRNGSLVNAFQAFNCMSYLSRPDEAHLQNVLSTTLMRLQQMFMMYYKCLKKPEYYLTILIQNSAVPSILTTDFCYKVSVSIHRRGVQTPINFPFDIFPWHLQNNYWETFGLYKNKRRVALAYHDPAKFKLRDNCSNWVEFFQKQWSRIKGDGLLLMKAINPFFDESILFNVGIDNSQLALLLDPVELLGIFRSRNIEMIKFVGDVFGPIKSEFYIDFKAAQALIPAPYLEETSDSYMNFLQSSSGSLVEVVKHLFNDNAFSLKDLTKFEEPFDIGKFSLKKIASFRSDIFCTKLSSTDVANKLNKPHGLRSCNHGVSCKQCPLLSLRTPTNPFWKRVMRVDNVYISFVGASALHRPGKTSKFDMIMEHLGPSSLPRRYDKTGSYVALEVYSKCYGFGPCSQQGVFYLLLIQDPKI